MSGQRRRKVTFIPTVTLLGLLAGGRYAIKGVRPGAYYKQSGTGVRSRANLQRALDQTNTQRASLLARPNVAGAKFLTNAVKHGAGTLTNPENAFNDVVNMLPNKNAHLKAQLGSLSPYLRRALSRAENHSIGNKVKEMGGAILNLPAFNLRVDLSKVPGFDKIAMKEFYEWGAMQIALSKAATPLSIQDAWQQLQTLDVIEKVFRTNPNLTADKDPYGIAPGSHVALPYTTDWRLPMVGAGVLGRFGKQRMKLAISGWDDRSTFFTQINTLFHHGVYVGDGMIMHVGGGGYNRYLRGNQAGVVGLDSLALMTGMGKGMYLVEHDTTINKYQVMYNLLRAPGPWKYSKLWKNCEHWATETVTGTPISAQIERIFTGVTVIVAMLTAGTTSTFASNNVKVKATAQEYIIRMFKESKKLGGLVRHALHAHQWGDMQKFRVYVKALSKLLGETQERVHYALLLALPKTYTSWV